MPIFRVFVTQQIEQGGLEDSIIEAPEFFSDMQQDGRYNTISGDVASLLFYQPFGINVEIHTDGSSYTQRLVSPHKKYPFGTTPSFNIFLKGEHFEIQPHNSPDMAEAVRVFEREIHDLPAELLKIHEDFSTSQSIYESDVALSRMVPYVFELVMQQLASDRALLGVKERDECCAPIDVVEGKDAELPLPSLGKDDEKTIKPSYVLNIENYAVIGKKMHSDTPSGRQTFAMILLTLHQGEENNKERAQQLIEYVQTLSKQVSSNKPLAAYLLDRLNTAIIENTFLSATPVEDVVNEIKLHLNYLENITAMRDNAKYKKFAQASEKTIEEAWILYRKTKDNDYLTAIQLTQAITKPKASSRRLLNEYEEFIQKLKGKGSLGKKLAGIMCMVLGLALIVAGAYSTAISIGISAPASVACIAAGIGLFRFGMDRGLYKEAKEVNNEAQQLFSQGI